MASLLIADAGSTKTDWCLMDSGNEIKRYKTSGINPLLQSGEELSESILQEELTMNEQPGTVDKIVFYGAGVKSEDSQKQLKHLFSGYFQSKEVNIHSDLLAAARATCGKEKGVVCILGTGSNSGYYDGEIIRTQNPSLGFILGDEGSGAFLGKRVLQYYFYRTFDGELSLAFEQKYGSDLSKVLHSVYQKPFASRYLARFVEFLKEHRGHYMIENIVEDALIDFYQKHILKYRESWKYPIHFCGSVAYEFKAVIQELHQQYGLEDGKILKSPIDELCKYHANEL